MSDGSSARTRRSFLTGAGAAGALALAGCTQSGGDGGGGGGNTDGTPTEPPLSGQVTVTGSSTVYPLATRMSSLFKEDHPQVTFSISPTGSGAGFSSHFCEGNSHVNNASRPITDAEQEACSENGVEPVELRVATDAVTVVVNNDNDWADCMTLEELAHVWRADDPATTWADVNSEWPDEEIELYGAADTSGTFDYFKEAVLEEGDHRTNYSATEKDNQIISGVQESQYAMGYLGFAYYDSARDKVQALSLDGGDGCVEPTLDTAKSGAYPLSRPLFTYPAKDALELDRVAEFCRFFVENSSSTEIVADQVGYVPNTEADAEAELEELNAAIEDANGA